MDKVSEFLANNYIWFLVATIILIFALIGFLVDSYNRRNAKEEKKDTKKKTAKKDLSKDQKISLNEAIKKESQKELEAIKKTQTSEMTEVLYDDPLIKDEEAKQTSFNADK